MLLLAKTCSIVACSSSLLEPFLDDTVPFVLPHNLVFIQVS